ncbi:Hypothetical_protein [Hexamita inflata]|uniref:Hypothetical_protein n=1 Tax=Hexamita inflata TaxID=28002 RepID=A0AA86N7X8_9EUKA|nr:Hypothetical protein HINF_LOCUS2063 [Hexamita inflata]
MIYSSLYLVIQSPFSRIQQSILDLIYLHLIVVRAEQDDSKTSLAFEVKCCWSASEDAFVEYFFHVCHQLFVNFLIKLLVLSAVLRDVDESPQLQALTMHQLKRRSQSLFGMSNFAQHRIFFEIVLVLPVVSPFFQNLNLKSLRCQICYRNWGDCTRIFPYLLPNAFLCTNKSSRLVDSLLDFFGSCDYDHVIYKPQSEFI